MRPRWGPRRLVWTVHRWLGLASGAVIFVVAFTGALYALAPEIGDLYLRRYGRVTPPPGARMLAPSAVAQRAEAAAERAAGSLPAGTRRWLTLSAAPDRSAVYTVASAGSSAWYEVYIDPYRGEVLIVRDVLWDPLGLILRAHQSLLLPEPIGRQVVVIAVLVFVSSLLTGLVLWFPRRPADLRQPSALRRRLVVDRHGSFFRIVYDLHRVLGGYALVGALIMALTGLVWSFGWRERGVSGVLTRGTPRAHGVGRTAAPTATGGSPAIDLAVAAAVRTFPVFVRLEVGLAARPGEALSVCANPGATTSYRTECLWFDQHTARLLGSERYRDKNPGERLLAMNYDIHTGRIAGIPGRLVAFLASLVAASLPLTGALIWWNRR